MTSVVLRFRRAGLEFSPDSLEMICNQHFPAGPLVAGTGGEAFRRVQKLVCLGVGLDEKATTETQIQHRVDQSRSAWIRHRALLRNPHVPAEIRYKVLQATVGASILHGAGTWHPSAHTRALLEQAEWRHLRWMSRATKDPAEEWISFYRRRHREAKTFRGGGTPSLWHRAVDLSFTWFGHVSRQVDRPAAALQRWRDLGWWRTVQAVRGPRDRTGRHPTRGWQRSLERTLEQLVGLDFLAQTSDRGRWDSLRPTFLKGCVENFGGALPPPPPDAKRRRTNPRR